MQVNLPEGSPPPLGDRFCQKIEWFKWPPPLNLKAGARLITVLTSSDQKKQVVICLIKKVHYKNRPQAENKIMNYILLAWASASFSSATFKFAT